MAQDHSAPAVNSEQAAHAEQAVWTDPEHSCTGGRVADRAEFDSTQALLHLVTGNSRDAITLSDGEVMEWCSPAFEDVVGIPAREVIGRSDLAELVHPDDHAVLEASRERLARMEEVELRCRVAHPDGTWHWVALRSRPLEVTDRGARVLSNWRIVDAEVAFIDALARSEANNRELAAQLQEALDSRVRIEQAKGMVAAQRSISPEAAFEVIRDHGRRHGRKLHDVAHDIIELGLRP